MMRDYGEGVGGEYFVSRVERRIGVFVEFN